ncbi:MAG: NAD-dependent epimerase/dehydratase family protein [Planctomycetaceae bacterium]|nr:NAD-dependent epimerase/dehydratase family protein [Planctomycetaceae bacterium]
MDVLVTGGGGFLGRYIVERLVARGDRVRSFGRKAYPELERLGVEVVRGDLRDENAVKAACRGVETVFHTAALPGIQCQWKPFYETNTLGTIAVIHGCLEHGVKSLVYTSSPSCVFDGKSQENVDESVPYPTRWLAHYPHSKALGEQAVLQANGPKLSTCSIRPHLIWGPRDQHLIPRLLGRAKRGWLVQVGDGSNLVDHLYVENGAAAHILAADALAQHGRNAGKAYSVSQGKPVNCWKWINEILKLAGLGPVKRKIPFRLAWTVGAAFELGYRCLNLTGEPPMTRFLAAQLSRHHYFNISAAKNDFGYEPEISTEEGMTRIFSGQR